MYLQDYELLKAQFTNNISACYFKMNDLQQADKWNNQALIECPDYAKAIYRKCLINEANEEYTSAIKMAEWGIQRFDDDLEVKENRDTVPAFKKIIERCRPLAGDESTKKANRMKEEAYQEIDSVFGAFQENEFIQELIAS